MSIAEKMKILIGYDGSTCADCALEDLRRAGLPRESEAVVLSVGEIWLPHPRKPQPVRSDARAPAAASVKAAPEADLGPADALEEARKLALNAIARLESYFTEWELRAEATSGSPAREILKKANEWSPDLIVVGCQGRSGLGRFLLGSVSQKVVSEARCSVRVTRGTAWKNGSPVRIVIGLDGSTPSQAAVRAVASRSWPMGSEVRIIAVEDQPGPLGRIAPGVANLTEGNHHEIRVWIEAFTEAATKQLRAAELAVSSKIEIGDPKQILVTDAEEWGADCIFLGSSGSGNHHQNIVLGSVATAVVARAQCSVEISRSKQPASV
jgi:nucleotide-binding universal stress UspA family protein